jgi:exodeoxyribonuclease VII large subunit
MEQVLTVKRLLEQVKARIEPPFSSVSVMGEVSNFRRSGQHWYFTLKEEGAAIQCAVWASRQRFLSHAPSDGQRVVVAGGLNLYVPGGSLTLVVVQCKLEGHGDLHARLRLLEAELRKEGLFDRPKRAIPLFPKKLGVAASLEGAALRDVLRVSALRAPGVDILVAPAAAQGERCIHENIMALQEIQDPFWGCDAILIVRGGGSLEDLWGFNDPELVRAIAECRLPVITGIGHEIDTTLADLAADRRAATPSQAAELATPDRIMLRSELQRRSDALQARIDWRLRGLETTLNMLSDSRGMHAVPQHIERLEARLTSAEQRLNAGHPQRKLEQAGARLALLKQRLSHSSISAAGELDRPRLQEARRRLVPAAERRLFQLGSRLDLLGVTLSSLDPRGPLSRGFALVKTTSGEPVTSAKSLPPASRARLEWLDGEREATVE